MPRSPCRSLSNPRPTTRRRASRKRESPPTPPPLQLEALEDRTLPAVFSPTTFADGTGPGTLRNAVLVANANGQDNTIMLVAGTYSLSPSAGGELALTGAGHALTIQGTGPGQTIITAAGGSRAFEVVGPVQVTFMGLTVTGGVAVDGGSLGGPDALGGGLLNNGGDVTLRSVAVRDNVAQAASGANAIGGGIYSNGNLRIFDSAISGNRAKGGVAVGFSQTGGSGLGAGLFVGAGSLSITRSAITGNGASGGPGGRGPNGANGVPVVVVTTGGVGRSSRGAFFGPGFFGPRFFGPGFFGGGFFGPGFLGSGFSGGPTFSFGPSFGSSGGFTGGSGFSGGGFSSGGFSGGGFSGSQRASVVQGRGGDGGVGGVGGRGQGGGLYVGGGLVSLSGVTLSGNQTRGGGGGAGGDPGTGNPPGVGGAGGAGGASQGAGIYVGGGDVTLTGVTFAQNVAQDSPGGAPGAAGSGAPLPGISWVGQGDRVFRAGGTVNSPPPPLVSLAGVGAFDPSTATWYLRNEAGPGAPDAGAFQFGGAGWKPVVGDWNGDGSATPGVFDPSTGTWYLRNENSAGAPDAGAFQYGGPGWVPVAGDWSGSGHAGIGAFDPSTGTWYLRNEASAGAPDAGVFQYGAPGWIPVVGDWRGDGVTTIGVVDPATMTWYLRSSNTAGAPSITPFQFGAPGWIPVVGDWTGDGTTSIGVVDPTTGTWYLRIDASAGAPDAGVFQYGAAGWNYLAGQWSPAPAPAGPLAEQAVGPPLSAAPDTGQLTNAELQATVAAALARLEAAGIAPALLARLQSATYEVGNLPNQLLGYTYARQHTVVLDAGAAGFGWFVDPTPLSNEEYAPSGTGALAAPPGSPAAGRMDLLTVVLHEMGHLAGRRDVNTAGHPNDLMDATLAPGLRRTDGLDAVFAAGLH